MRAACAAASHPPSCDVVAAPGAPLSAAPPRSAVGGSSTLTWASGNATSCVATNVGDASWTGSKLITGGTQVVSPSATATYTLTCDGAGGAQDSQSTTVTVGPAPGASLTADFTTIALGGSSNGSTLEGHSYTYVGSIWGRIVDILMETECMNPIIYIDELDKVSRTEHGRELIGILTHMLHVA